MNTPSRLVPLRFLKAIATTAEHRSIDLAPWLDEFGIDRGIFVDDGARVTAAQSTLLVQELWRRTDDELFGLSGEPVPRGTFRLLSLAVLGAANLGSVLARWSDFSKLLPGFPAMSVVADDNTARVEITLDPENDPEGLVTDIVLAVNLRFLAWLTGQRLPVEVVLVPYPMPEGAEDYDPLFGRRVVYEQAVAAYVIDSKALTWPLIRGEEETEQWLRESPADLLVHREYTTRVGDQVRRILERSLRGEWATSDQVAAQLSMSTQHLRRVLREEGFTMTQIKEELLRNAAIASLVRGEESVAELSERLGFSEPSAFYRAFRRWTGNAPGFYRPSDPD